MATVRPKLSPDEVREALRRVRLVTLTEAGRMIGVKAPNVTRMRNEGKFPEPVTEIVGGAGVYDEREVKALGRQLARKRRNGGE